MSEKCPYCYQFLGTWSHDPILRNNGCPYKWINDTTLESIANIEDRIYKGIYQIRNDEIIQLQDYLKQLEEDNLTPEQLTTFSPINTSGYFQITGYHIKEMRDSIEKLLTAFSLTKVQYFNYDANDNHIIHPNGDKTDWIDPITDATDLVKFQVKDIHIEDLRHYISQLYANIYLQFQSTEYNPETDKFMTYYGYKEGKLLDESFNKLVREESSISLYNASIDNQYLYVANLSGSYGYLYVYNRNTLAPITSIVLGSLGTTSVYFKVKNDTNYVYIYGYGDFSGGYKTKVWKVQKENLSEEPPLTWQLLTTISSTIIWYGFFITKDHVCLSKNNYPLGTSDFLVIAGEEDYQLYTSYASVLLLNKSDLSTNHIWTSEHYSGEHFIVLPSAIEIKKFANLDYATDVLLKDTFSINNEYVFTELHIKNYDKSGETYILNSETGEFAKNVLDLTVDSLFITIKEITDYNEMLKYYKIIIDKNRIYAYYRTNISPYFYIMFLDTSFNELYSTNILIYEEIEEEEIVEKEISIYSELYCFCSDNQYLFAT